MTFEPKISTFSTFSATVAECITTVVGLNHAVVKQI